MRRKFLTLITLMLALIISVSSLSACKLITVNDERDLNQVVATVQINKDAPKEEILKKDMIMSYLNYGYMYEQYGYTREKIFTMIIKDLIENRVYIQNAIEEFNSGDSVFDSIPKNKGYDKWDLDRYLKIDETDADEKNHVNEIVEAEYFAKKTMNEIIDAYETQEDEEQKESLSEEVRTVPTNAQNAEKEEPLLSAKKTYKIDTNSTAERRKAFNKVVKLLDSNGLLGEDYNGDLTTSQYYLELVKDDKESTILEKYEDCIRADIFSKVDFNEIKTAHENKFNEQKEWTNAEFVSALSSASTADPILVSNGTGYGYVYNLLLGASTEQTTAISNIDKTISVAEKAAKRKLILDETKVKDLRSSWILSGYDFDGEKFTGDYTFTKPENSFSFKGVVEKIKDAIDDKPAEYKILSLTEYSLNGFIDMMEEYVYGKPQTPVADSNLSVYKKVYAPDIVNGHGEYEERINELLFAFSTDPGSLNTYKGYVIKPEPDGANKEEYMQEFADAGRDLLKNGSDKSYIMVATDYGYHVMFYSQVFSNTDANKNLVDYLNTFENKNWEDEFDTMMADYVDYEYQDSYLYLLTDSVISTKVNNTMTTKQRKILNKYVYSSDSYVVRYESRYADLFE